MAWFKVDDKLWGSPKWVALKSGPRALWVTAGSYSMDQLTDGFVPLHVIGMLGGRKDDCKALIAAGLWREEANGYRFHDWEDYQPSRDSILEKREAEARRKAEWRRKRAAQRDSSGNGPADVPAGQDEDNRVSPVDVPPMSRSSRPDPTRPDPTVVPTELPIEAASRPRRRSPERPLPDDWQPTDTHRDYARQHGLDLDREVFKFRNHAAANERMQRNWNAAFSQWLATSEGYARPAQAERPKIVRDQWLLR